MADYTTAELEQMLVEKHDEEMQQEQMEFTSSTWYKLRQELRGVRTSSDYEMISHLTTGSFKTPIARVHKSETQNKQFIETFYYWNETRDDVIVARANTSSSYTTGSYGESYTTPTLQILGTRVKDLTIPQG